MQLIDTHCHIHFPDYGLDANEVIKRAKADDVTGMICVGCTLEDSGLGVDFARSRPGVWPAIGLHPHEAHHYVADESAKRLFRQLAQDESVIAIGECGLDYYYNHSPKAAQIQMLEFQIDVALRRDVPLIFHVREAFDDFLPILDNFSGVRGVVHSFTAGTKVMDKLVERGLHIGLNGIMTFTKDEAQITMAKSVPSGIMLLETDAPFLTPEPYRGKMCEPRHVVETARFLSTLRNEPLEELAAYTTNNAKTLFSLDI
jgi:TatD DNase family protein